MGIFSEAIEKFAGFAGKSEVTKLAQKEALRFEHFKSADILSTTVYRGAEPIGFFTTSIEGESAHLASTLVFEPGKGIGSAATKEIAGHLFGTSNIQQLTNDIVVGSSEPAMGMWGKLTRAGQAEAFTYEKEGMARTGYRITRGMMKQENIAAEIEAARAWAEKMNVNKEIMEAGSGSSNTSMLKRGLMSTRGYRRTTGAL